MGIPDQRARIWKKDWNYLIVLDACRYDYFEKVYKKYPILRRGRLEKVCSPGSSTREWLLSVFGNGRYDDVVYISANPFVNSKGIPYRGFDPKRYFRFHKIVDVWDFGWVEELKTVHPGEVNKAVLVAVKLYRNKNFVIHYMQPHYPYLRFNVRAGFSDRLKGVVRREIADMLGEGRLRKLVRRFIGLLPSDIELLARKGGVRGVRRAYEENLEIVLGYVARLLRHLHGKVVVTSDHGELLGERGMFDHPYGKRFPELIEVPWLEVLK